MAKVYADLIRKGRKKFADVPDKIKAAVKDALDAMGLAELAEEEA